MKQAHSLWKNKTKIAKFQTPVFPDPAAGTDIPLSIKKRRTVSLVCKVPSQLLRSDRGSEDQLLLQSAECLTWLFKESHTRSPPLHAHIYATVTLLSHVWNLVWETHQGQSAFHWVYGFSSGVSHKFVKRNFFYQQWNWFDRLEACTHFGFVS